MREAVTGSPRPRSERVLPPEAAGGLRGVGDHRGSGVEELGEALGEALFGVVCGSARGASGGGSGPGKASGRRASRSRVWVQGRSACTEATVRAEAQGHVQAVTGARGTAVRRCGSGEFVQVRRAAACASARCSEGIRNNQSDWTSSNRRSAGASGNADRQAWPASGVGPNRLRAVDDRRGRARDEGDQSSTGHALAHAGAHRDPPRATLRRAPPNRSVIVGGSPTSPAMGPAMSAASVRPDEPMAALRIAWPTGTQ